MPTVQELKSKAQAAIEGRREWLIGIAKSVLDTPEAGFQELKTCSLFINNPS